MEQTKPNLLEAVMNLEPVSGEELAEFKPTSQNGRFRHSGQAKAAISAAKAGKPMSQTHKIAISEAKYLYTPNKDHCEAISEGMKRYWVKRKAEAAKRAARVAFYKAEKAARVVNNTGSGEPG